MRRPVMTLLHTQWAVTGSAISSLKAMTYSSETRLWSLDTDLSPGTLKFTTIAVGYGDPIIVYGASEGLSKLSEEGGHRNRDGWELYDYTEFESAAVL